MTAEIANFAIGRAEYNASTQALAPARHAFGSDVDDLSTIATSAYFNDILADAITGGFIKINDFIDVSASDPDAQSFKITAVSPNVTLAVV